MTTIFGPHRSATARHAIRCLVLSLLVVAGASAAAPEGTGLPLPRFVSLRATEANIRTGPGVQYPVEWVYFRRYLPLEVIAEYRTWRKIRDWQGTQGWMHQGMLDSRRTVIVTGKMRTLRERATSSSSPVARVESGVIGRVLECPDGGWCRLDIDGFEGWLRRVEVWGIYRTEVLQ